MELNGKFYSYKISEGYDNKLRECIEITCKYCIHNTALESEEKIKKPIMLLGKIQSGKTRAYTGLIALAFDNGFDMVFILSKNSKPLINQTVSRMKKEFKDFIYTHEIIVSDIMKSNSRISGYQLEQKNIIVAKKEKNNIDKVINFINEYSINKNKKCLIIDDEADTTGIGYNKIKGEGEYTLRMVSSKVNQMRGSLEGCVFIQVTATPYALYLQPDFDNYSEIHPIRPMNTVLVPHGEEYIGGEYYFIESRDEKHRASYLFEPVDVKEHELVSDQKRKGKKSKINDKRSFRLEDILFNEEKLPTFKHGIINFIVGVIVLKYNEKNNCHYSYVIHTATQKGSHLSLQGIAEVLFDEIKNRNDFSSPIIFKMLKRSYADIECSVSAYGEDMPSYKYVEEQFYKAIDRGHYSIDIVNSDTDVETLLNEETGELYLPTPFSIFVGGQVLDRGVTIPNMVGFYYGRNPKSMQQDTVLQHSRMFGYRKELLPVTRFYTTKRIHSNMEKITEIDMELREDLEEGKQGKGIYFIARREQDDSYGKGSIQPCSPDKIRVSDILLLKSHKRILPVGFTSANKMEFTRASKEIETVFENESQFEQNTFLLSLAKAEEIIGLVYRTIIQDDENSRFVTLDEFIMAMRYLVNSEQMIFFNIYRNMDISKFKDSGRSLQDAPDTSRIHTEKAKRFAIDKPCIMLFQEKGLADGWHGRPFWWPVLVVPQNAPKTIYASKILGEKILSKKDEN